VRDKLEWLARFSAHPVLTDDGAMRSFALDIGQAD
jgi:hypothetical protein